MIGSLLNTMFYSETNLFIYFQSRKKKICVYVTFNDYNFLFCTFLFNDINHFNVQMFLRIKFQFKYYYLRFKIKTT